MDSHSERNGKLEISNWDEILGSKFFIKMDLKSIAVIKVPIKTLFKKEYKIVKNKTYYYQVLMGVSFLNYTGKVDILFDEEIPFQFGNGTAFAIKKAWKVYGNDDWEYIIVYRKTKRVSKVKILTVEEVKGCKNLSHEELLERYFEDEFILNQERIEAESES